MSIDISTTAPLAALPEDSSSRLMRMLESVRLEKTEVEPVPVAGTQRNVCAQCQSPEPWGNSSWCPECGYYPKLGRAMTPSEVDASQHRRPAISLTWLIWLGLGIACLTAGSVGIRMLFPDEVDRGSFGRTQFIAGIMLLLAGQVRAFIVATHGRDNLPLSSLFFEPFQLWLPVARQLPQTRHALYLGVWGGTALMLAVSVTGMDFNGMFSGMRPTKPKKSMMQMIVQVVSATANKTALSGGGQDAGQAPSGLSDIASGIASSGNMAGSGNIEDAMKEFSGAAAANSIGGMEAGSPGSGPGSAAQIAASFSADPAAAAAALQEEENRPLFSAEKIPLSASGRERSDQGEFVIFGYMTNPAGEIRSLLLAEVRSRRARYVGKLPLDELSDTERNEVQMQLDEYRSSRPALRIAYHARWVQPVLSARIAHVGWTPDGQLREGFLTSVERIQRSRSAPSASGTSRP